MIRRHPLLIAVLTLALAAGGCAYESSGTTTTTIVDPDAVPPDTGPADIVFTDQQTDGAGVVVESVTLPSDGFVVLHSDQEGTPGSVIGQTDLLSSGIVANVPVSFFVPIEENTVVHAMVHVDMDRDGTFTYEPPDSFVDVPATFANGEPAAAAAIASLLAPFSPAAVDLGEQRTLGESVTVAAVSLPAPGFVAILTDDGGAPGAVIGVSELLAAGTTNDVEVPVEPNLDESLLLWAAAYIDRDGDEVLTLEGEDAVDRIGQTEDGQDAVAGSDITVVPRVPTTLRIEDQAGDGSVLTVASVRVPSPGFVVVRDDRGGEPGEVVGVVYLPEAGATDDLEVDLDPPLEADATLWVRVQIDLDGNGEFDGDEPNARLGGGGGRAEVSVSYTIEIDTGDGDGDGGGNQ